MINQYLLAHKVEVTDGKRIWYVAELSGYIVEVNLFSKELKCIWKIPNSAKEYSYRLLFYCEQKLYVFPYNQSVMYVYDLDTSRYEKIEVKKKPEFMGCIKRRQFLYVFGCQSEILKYNLENGAVTYIDTQSEFCNIKGIPSGWFWTNSFILNETIYIPVTNSNIIIMLDRHDKVSSLCLGNKPERWILENIQVDNGRYHVIHCEGGINDIRTYISEYDLNGMLIMESSVEEKYSYQIYPFVNAIWTGDRWICLPFGRKEVLLRDGEHDEILYEIDNGIDFLNHIIQGLFYCSVWVNDYMICCVEQSTGGLIFISMNDLAVKHSSLKLEDNMHCLSRNSYQDAIKFHSAIKEMKDFCDINHYINYICKDENIQVNRGAVYAESNTIWSRTRW